MTVSFKVNGDTLTIIDDRYEGEEYECVFKIVERFYNF